MTSDVVWIVLQPSPDQIAPGELLRIVGQMRVEGSFYPGDVVQNLKRW